MNNHYKSPLLSAAVIIVSLLIANFAFPELVKTPATIPTEKGSVEVSESNGNARWSADWTMEPSTINGRPAVRFTENGSGRYSPFKQEVRWSLSAVWTADGVFKPLHVERTFRSLQGAVLETDTRDFDPAKGSVRVTRNKPNTTPESHTASVPADTIAVDGIGGILRFLPFGEKFRLHLFSNDDHLWEMTLEPRGREMVHTPAGDFDCYKIEMVPHLGVLGVVRKFLPKTYMWFAVAPPHFWVKYEGLENGVDSPHIVMQLKTYEPAKQTQ